MNVPALIAITLITLIMLVTIVVTMTTAIRCGRIKIGSAKNSHWLV